MNQPFTLVRVTPPEIEPVTLAEMKLHSRMFTDITTEDEMVEGLITEAREWVEDYTGRALIDQTWKLTVDPLRLNELPVPVGAVSSGQELFLHRSPVLELLTVTSVDSLGAETALDVADFVLRAADSKWPRLVAPTWAGDELQIVFRAGFADRHLSPAQGAELVPAVLKRAIKIIASHYYTHREPIIIGTIATDLSLSIKWLLASQRCEFGGVA